MNLLILEKIAEGVLPIIAVLLKDKAGEVRLLEEYRDCYLKEALEIYEQTRAELKEKKEYERYFHLRELAGGEAGAMVLDCAIACALYPRLEGLLIENYEGGCSFSLYSGLQKALSYEELYTQSEKLSGILPVREEGTIFFRRSFYADERILNYLAGIHVPVKEVKHLAYLHNPENELQTLYINQTLVPHLQNLISQEYPIQLAGEDGHGKRLLLKHALNCLKKWGIFVDGRVLAREKNIDSILWKLRREALLLEGVVCIYGITVAWEKELGTSLLPLFLQIFENIPLCLCTSSGINLTSCHTGDWNRLELPQLHQKDWIALWKGYCCQFKLQLNPAILGSKYRLSPAQISQAARRISEAESPVSQVLMQACIDVLPAVSGSVKQMNVSYTFDDLKVTPQTRAILDNICAHVNHREQVYGQWDLESRYAYGKSISALFSGPPGTGKTMAAHVLSSSLMIPLYSVNLSQIVDKYIGETEKKLEQVFELAEKSNTILFFDEADSLFGKRSQVNDSKDRYANIEVSYILQRLEQYDGIVILATNHKGNMDEAFMRRIRYIADFPMPDEQLRKEIWQGCFSQKTPILDIDFDFLAKNFEFSGGDIKNIALNAAFLAAQADSDGIGMVHVLQSIQMDYRKNNRILMKGDLGIYAGLIF